MKKDDGSAVTGKETGEVALGLAGVAMMMVRPGHHTMLMVIGCRPCGSGYGCQRWYCGWNCRRCGLRRPFYCGHADLTCPTIPHFQHFLKGKAPPTKPCAPIKKNHRSVQDGNGAQDKKPPLTRYQAVGSTTHPL